jgi:hypothetical protein
VARERFALGIDVGVVGVVDRIGADHVQGTSTERSRHNWPAST